MNASLKRARLSLAFIPKGLCISDIRRPIKLSLSKIWHLYFPSRCKSLWKRLLNNGWTRESSIKQKNLQTFLGSNSVHPVKGEPFHFFCVCFKRFEVENVLPGCHDNRTCKGRRPGERCSLLCILYSIDPTPSNKLCIL